MITGLAEKRTRLKNEQHYFKKLLSQCCEMTPLLKNCSKTCVAILGLLGNEKVIVNEVQSQWQRAVESCIIESMSL